MIRMKLLRKSNNDEQLTPILRKIYLIKETLKCFIIEIKKYFVYWTKNWPDWEPTKEAPFLIKGSRDNIYFL